LKPGSPFIGPEPVHVQPDERIRRRSGKESEKKEFFSRSGLILLRFLE
jgi:hypothetical protein